MLHRSTVRPAALLAVPLGLALVACDSALPAPGDPGLDTIDLRAALDADDAAPVGIAITPDGRRFVLDVVTGLSELLPDGTARRVLSPSEFPIPDVPVDSSFTDIAALADDQFAITAINDGFVLDLTAGTLTQHFCYVPPALPDDVNQLTLSVAYDPEADLIHAQPQSFDGINGLFASQVGSWDRQSGADLAWYNLADIEYLAGGMAVESSGVLLLARDAAIERYRFADASLEPVADLSEHGLVQIDGLAIDPASDSILVIDSIADIVVELPRAALSR